jgi:hypothetical protein
MITDSKAKLYKTAISKSPCLYFKEGDVVSVSNPWRSSSGVLWFEIHETQHGKIPCVVYPENLLSDFVL